MHEQINKLVVFVFAYARMARAHVHRIVKQRLIVGADIEHDWQRMSGAYPSAGGVK